MYLDILVQHNAIHLRHGSSSHLSIHKAHARTHVHSLHMPTLAITSRFSHFFTLYGAAHAYTYAHTYICGHALVTRDVHVRQVKQTHTFHTNTQYISHINLTSSYLTHTCVIYGHMYIYVYTHCIWATAHVPMHKSTRENVRDSGCGCLFE